MQFLRASLLTALASALVPSLALAQTPLSGPLSDGTTGPLLSGTVYHATSPISVPAGQALTVQPGAIVKLTTLFTVDGTLDVNGTSGSPVIFTSLQDDSAGGDTNANGPSTGSPGDWSGIFFRDGSDASTLEWAQIRFPGAGNWTGAYLSSADVTFTSCTFASSSSHGLTALNTSFPSVTGCTFTDNVGDAITGIVPDALAAISNNSASGNGADFVRLSGGVFGSSATITPAHCLGGALVVVGNLTMPAGSTLTLAPDVVLKFTSGLLQIHGTLLANGTSSQPVVLTHFTDDDYAGDTNKDGASSGTPGSWAGIRFSDLSDASVVTETIVRFGGAGNWSNFYLTSADITVVNTTSRDCSTQGINLNSSSKPSVSGCSFLDNAGVAIEGVQMDGLPLFANNSASGNGFDYMRVTVPSPTASLAILKSQFPGPALVLTGSCTVPAGATLTLEPGVILKFLSGLLRFDGTLDAQGSASDPIVFTVYEDDDWGGDTNQDGASSGTPGAWAGIRFTDASDASVLDDVVIRFGGGGNWSNLYLSSADITLTDTVSRDCSTQGMNLTSSSRPSVSGCTFLDNGGVAVEGVQLDGLPLLTGNTATNNAGGDYLRVTVPSPTVDTVVSTASLLGSPLVMIGSCTVPSGVTLTLDPGVVLKFTSGLLTVQGTLLANGTVSLPNAITVFADDDWGGDTNLDGPSSGTPGAWSGIRFMDTSDSSSLSHTEIRFGGAGNWSNLYLSKADIELRDCVSRDCATSGMNLTITSRPDARGCEFRDNGRYAVEQAEVEALPGFSLNTSSGNTLGDYIFVNDLGTSEDVSVEHHQLLDGVLVADAPGTVGAGTTLSIEAGIPVKIDGAGQLVVQGTLDVLGTSLLPVVVTQLVDDSVAGDTNKDGAATAPGPGMWSGVRFISTAEGGLLRDLEVRWAGAGSWAGLTCSSPAVVLDGVRVDSSSADGIDLSDVASATGLCAWSCAGDGLQLSSGGFDVTQVTAEGNGGWGIRRLGGHFGSVVDAIAWNNTAGNYTGFAGGGDLGYSNGDATLAGSFGNINVDPLFVDAPGGDLHLQLGSPSIDAGDPALGLDPDCTPRDQGAYFNDVGGIAPSTFCTAKTASPGCVPTMDFVGHASATDPTPFTITAGDIVNKKNGLLFYGVSGPNSAPFQGGFLCVNPPVTRTPGQNSGGNPAPDDCSGTFSIDFNAYLQSGVDPKLLPGVEVHGQFWGRDPLGPFTTLLTDGVRFVICP